MVARKSLLGRDAELALATQRLQDAAGGRGGVLLITGEPGIGKSALAAAIAERAAALSLSVTAGRALELSSAPPWLPVRPCLRAIGIARSLLPVDEQEVYGLWEEVLAALSEAAMRAPIVWVLEDLHAADVQTLDLLVFLAHPLRALPVLIVITVRERDPLRAGAVGDRLARLARAGEVVPLARLSDDAIAALVKDTATRSLAAPRVAELVAHAKGLPLFAIELARAAGAPRATLPASVVQVVQERLSLLPPQTREALEHAAVLGRELSAGSLGRLMDRLPAAVIDDLAPALRSGLLEELAPGRFQFSHALVRDAIHDALPSARRRAAHAQAERILAEQPDTLDRLTLRASHALEAGDAIDDAHAAEVIARAVSALCTDGARERAFSLHRQWLDSRVRAPEPQLLLQTARLAAAAGVFAECTRFANEALAIGQSRGDAALVGEAALVLGTNLRAAIVDRQLVRALQDALERLQREPESDGTAKLRCRVRARLAAALQPALDWNEPVVIAREALRDAHALGDPALIRDVLFLAGSAMTSCVPPRESYDIATELLERARAVSDAPVALRASVRRICHALELGMLEVLGRETDELMLFAESVGLPALRWRPLLIGSMRALAQGHFAESERLIGEVEELSALTDDPALKFGLFAHAMGRSLFTEDAGIRALRDAYLKILPQAGPQPYVRALLFSYVALRLEDRPAAERELEEMMRGMTAIPDSFTPSVAGELAAFVGNDAQRRAARNVLEPLRSEHAHTGQVDFFYAGPVERVLGLLESALGEHDAAIASFASARACCDRHGLKAWLARIDLDLGRARIAADRLQEAREALQRALDVANALPMPLTAERAQRALDTLAASTPASGAAQPASAPEPERASTPIVAASSITLEQAGDVWRARYGSREALVKDSRGVQLLARLIAAPGERVHVLALSSDEGGALGETHAGAALDMTALKRYRARLAELDDEIAAAESADDATRAERMREEHEAITAELRRAVGLGGRLRKVGSVTERARINVTRRLRDAMARVAEVHPELGRYLAQAIRTGTYCSFRP